MTQISMLANVTLQKIMILIILFAMVLQIVVGWAMSSLNPSCLVAYAQVPPATSLPSTMVRSPALSSPRLYIQSPQFIISLYTQLLANVLILIWFSLSPRCSRMMCICCPFVCMIGFFRLLKLGWSCLLRSTKGNSLREGSLRALSKMNHLPSFLIPFLFWL